MNDAVLCASKASESQSLLSDDITECSWTSHPSHGPAQLMDWLYIGDVTDADSHGLIKELGITHVLNCAGSSEDIDLGVRSCLRKHTRTEISRKSSRCQTTGGMIRQIRGPYGGDSGVRVFRSVPALDNLSYDMLQHFELAKTLINEARDEGGRALLYCNKGVNRSVTLCVAYLMDLLGCGMLVAVQRVARVRGRILTNTEFRRQLMEFENLVELRDRDIKNSSHANRIDC